MSEFVMFSFVTLFSSASATPQGVVMLAIATSASGVIILLYSSTIWPGALFLLGIVGGLTVLLSFTFMMFPKESFKESEKLLLLKKSNLLTLFFSLFFCFLYTDEESPFWFGSESASGGNSSFCFDSLSECFSSSSFSLLIFIFLFLFLILLSVETITKLIV
nr:NADH dehydrogenase subunit 6 [Polyplax reclinata]